MYYKTVLVKPGECKTYHIDCFEYVEPDFEDMCFADSECHGSQKCCLGPCSHERKSCTGLQTPG